MSRAIATAGVFISSIVIASCGAKFKTSSDGESPDESYSGGSTAETARDLEPSGGFDDKVAIRDESSKYPKSPQDEWLFPILDGGYGSKWCVCRSIGTSPHVGVDLVDTAKLPNQVSIAISNGKVESVDYSPTCGWSVKFRGSGGSLWRYLHLNKPGVKAGQEVVRGTTFGINKDYPKSGCGNGAHLHLERRSAGSFGSKEEFRSCQYGRTSCYYNPVSLIDKAIKLPNDSARYKTVQQTIASLKSKDSSSYLGLTSFKEASPSTDKLDFSHVSEEENGARTPNCSTTFQALEVSPLTDGEALQSSGNQVLEVSALLSRPVTDTEIQVSFSLSLRGNPENNCSLGGEASPVAGSSCISSWKVFLRDSNGQSYLVFEGTGAGNTPVEVSAEREMCASLPKGAAADSLTVIFQAKDPSGQILTKISEL